MPLLEQPGGIQNGYALILLDCYIIAAIFPMRYIVLEPSVPSLEMAILQFCKNHLHHHQ